MFRFIALSISPPSTTLSRTARQGQRMSTLSLSFNFLACRFSTARIYRPLPRSSALFLPPSLCGSIDKSCRWPPTMKLPTYLPAKNLLPSPRPASSTWFVIIPHNGSRLSHHSFRSFGLQGFRVFSKDKFMFMMTPANLSGTVFIPLWFKIV